MHSATHTEKNTLEAHSPASDQGMVVSILQVAFALRKRFESEMQKHGVTSQQYNVLRILRGAGEPLPTMEVAARMIEPEPGITRMVRRLEAKGLVCRSTCASDARKALCTVTDKGLQIVHALDQPVERLNRELCSGLEDEAKRSAIAVLRHILSNTENDR